MSMIIAHEMGTNIKITTGPSIEKTGDLVAILTHLNREMFYLLMKFICLK